MESAVAILRGINVSGHRLIKMEALKAMCETLGLRQVKTYIQSGNIVFKAPQIPGLDHRISKAILEQFGHEVPVMVRSYKSWRQIIAANPYTSIRDIDLSKCHVTLLSGQPAPGAFEKNIPESGNDSFRLVDGTVYLYTPGGYGKTRYSNSFFEKRLACLATTRNWNTMLTLAEMCENLDR